MLLEDYFISHQYFSREDAQDAIYHQCQVIFRNSNTSGAGLYQLLRMLGLATTSI
jgi:hypothetical protein